MTAAIVQSKRGTWTAGDYSETYTSAPSPGNRLVAALYASDAVAEITTAGWSVVRAVDYSAGLDHVTLYHADDSAGQTVTVNNISGTGRQRLHLFEVSGGVDVQGSATTSIYGSGTITGPTLTPSDDGILLAFVFGRNATYQGTATITPTGPLSTLFSAEKYSRGHDWAGTRSVTSGVGVTPTVAVSGQGFRNSWGEPACGMLAVTMIAAPAAIPAANFTGTPVTGIGSCNTAFTDTSTNTPTSWAWDFGDGDTSTSQNPSHNYTDVGTYDVELTATNADGSDTLTRVAYVVVQAVPTPGAG